MKSRITKSLVIIAVFCLAGTLPAGTALGAGPPFEVWALDQSGTAGTLYVYDGLALGASPTRATPEVIDLAGTVAALCSSQTGAAPTRAHMLLFNRSQTHAILSYVATGHVVFMDAATRSPVACIDVGDQAHAAFPAPDESYVVVANQNGKLLQRITTDYATNSFTIDNAATLNVATCSTPNGWRCQDDGSTQVGVRPNNVVICPVVDSSSRWVFVTLGGGGLFVVDGKATPMGIVAEYDRDAIHANGCGGVEKGGKMFITSGGGPGNATEADVYAFDLRRFPASGFNAPNTPLPRWVFSKDAGEHDTHGALLTKAQDGAYAWFGDRFANAVEVVDTRTSNLVNTFSLRGPAWPDPAPDLMGIAPGGDWAFAALRGPCPLTANDPAAGNAVGSTPGIGVIAVERGGFSGRLVGVASISSPTAQPFDCPSVAGEDSTTDRADPHGIAVRSILPQLRVSLSSTREGDKVSYSATIANTAENVMAVNAYLAIPVPPGVSVVRATASPRGTGFRGLEGGAAAWIVETIPAGGSVGPFTYTGQASGDGPEPVAAFLHWLYPQEGSLVSNAAAP